MLAIVQCWWNITQVGPDISRASGSSASKPEVLSLLSGLGLTMLICLLLLVDLPEAYMLQGLIEYAHSGGVAVELPMICECAVLQPVWC